MFHRRQLLFFEQKYFQLTIALAKLFVEIFWCGPEVAVFGREYSRVHRNWQRETAVWNLAGFLHYALNPRWQRFGQLLNDFRNNFLQENLDFLCENLIYENLRFFV